MPDNKSGGRHEESLAAFLLARLAEDEDIALAALEAISTGESVGEGALARHAAQHDPARVLREVCAKRTVVEAWLNGLLTRPVAFHPADVEVAEITIAALAAVHCNHPDFRPDWLPHSAKHEPDDTESGHVAPVIGLHTPRRPRRPGRSKRRDE